MPARPASAHLQLMLMKPRLISDASAIISGRLKWPPHPSITQKCWELAKISGKLSLERHSASVTLLPLKSMTSVTLLDWEQSDPWGNLPSYSATQSLLKNQRGHFRIRMDEKNLLFWCREGGMAHIQAHDYRLVLTEEGRTEQRFAKLSEGSEHCQAPRKTIPSEIHVLQIRI